MHFVPKICIVGVGRVLYKDSKKKYTLWHFSIKCRQVRVYSDYALADSYARSEKCFNIASTSLNIFICVVILIIVIVVPIVVTKSG